MSHVLTLNAGSSSLKFAVYTRSGAQRVLSGQVERIGDQPRLRVSDGETSPLDGQTIGNAAEALAPVLAALRARGIDGSVGAIGHRVVHGGTRFQAPVRLTRDIEASLQALSPFAPLHQPHNLAVVKAARETFPDALQVACFDTAFHRAHPRIADIYALPRAYAERGVRRYGFHGLSYEAVTGKLARMAPDLHAGRVVIAHLGSGASMAAVAGGRPIASSMGLTALDGLPMGTRCGEIDPGVLLYLLESEGLDLAGLTDLLYRQSGLLGLSGLSSDMRVLEASETEEAAEAVAYFVDRARREIGALTASLGGLDGLVFCGGIGENAPAIRAAICERMGWLGIALDPARNATGEAEISGPDSAVRTLVIPTDEEAVIAEAVIALATKSDPA